MAGSGRVTAQARRAVRLHDDAPASAAAAGLRYVTDSEPGLTRVRCGRGFSYRDDRGRLVAPDQRQRIGELAIPPAWREVWICPSPDGHLQATGLDDRGRKQYLYHPRWRQLRDGVTFDRLALIGSVLASTRIEVESQLRRRTVDRARVLAGMVRLLDLTGIRVGNEVYERDNASIGLTTLTWRHVSLHGPRVVMSFPAKSAQRAEIAVTDRGLARLLGELAGPRRRRVFRADGHPLRAEDLNGYLSQVSGAHVTAKDFRTWRGTVAALTYLRSVPATSDARRRHGLAAIDAAAAALNNTRAIARAHYVHPGLIHAFESGTLRARVNRRHQDHLLPEELDLIELLPTLVGAEGV